MAREIYERPTPQQIDDLSIELHKKVRKLFDFDAIAIVGSGGFVVGKKFIDLERGRGYDVPYFVISCYRYTNDGILEKPRILPLSREVKRLFKNLYAAIVDAVNDNGVTRDEVYPIVRKITPNLAYATLHDKQKSEFPGLHVYVVPTPNWIIYPWEINETQWKVLNRARIEGWTLEEIAEEFNAAQFTEDEIRKFSELNGRNRYSLIADKIRERLFK